MDKCYQCLFKSEYRDMGASVPICTRCRGDLLSAIEAYNSQEPCQWHITKDEVIKLQEDSSKYRY